jgi:hypothetical protein
MSLQKQAAMNLVLGRRAAITGKPSADQNIEAMTLRVDMVVLGRDHGISSMKEPRFVTR